MGCVRGTPSPEGVRRRDGPRPAPGQARRLGGAAVTVGPCLAVGTGGSGTAAVAEVYALSRRHRALVCWNHPFFTGVLLDLGQVPIIGTLGSISFHQESSAISHPMCVIFP